MKIGILTLHWVPNFGANLQALTSVSYLKSLGHQVTIIDYQPKKMVKLYETKVPEEQWKIHRQFVSDYFQISGKTYSDYKQLNEDIANLDFDIVLAGSDALVRLNYDKADREDLHFPNPFWLDWTFEASSKIKKRGFLSVSSMGTDYRKLKNEVKEELRQHLSRFEIISVRDGWTRKMMKHISPQLEVKETIDPVFLMSDYFEIPKKHKVKNKDDYILFCPNLNDISENWAKKLIEAAHKAQLKVIALPHPEGFPVNSNVDGFTEYPIHPLKWYSYIANSSGYVGVRFHPIITCLENGVPFVALDQYHKHFLERNRSKTYDICKKLGLEKYCFSKNSIRFLSPSKVIKLLKKQKTINYEVQLKILKEDLKKYLNFYINN